MHQQFLNPSDPSPGFVRRLCIVSLLGLVALGVVAVPSAAQDPAAAAEEVAAAAQAASIDSGDTAWMLVSSALVLLMTPGLALFYAGMVRSKNVLGTVMHSMFAMGIMTIVWAVVGYSIGFGETVNGLFGNPATFAFLKDVSHDAPRDGETYPHSVFMIFQMMFAIITPALITGAFAERVKFRAYALFIVLWGIFVYSPLAHWVWGGGLLSGSEHSIVQKMFGTGALDFAGGTVVHISSGVSALVFAIMIGRRRGYPDIPMKPNNLVFTLLGAGLLWFGWYGFNAGSQLAADGGAARAFVVTHICAAAGAVSWAIVERIHQGKASALGFASGIVAGLVCITPAAGFVDAMPALLMGLVVSPICYICVACLKPRLGYDDSLDAFGIHGIGGTVGAIFTGVFAIDLAVGRGAQIGSQVVAVLVTWIFAGVATAILVKVIDVTIGIRLSEDDELEGLDLTQHGEVGYNL